MIELGQRVRCKVTGFKGVATARVEYLNGCIQYHIRPKVRKDGKWPDGVYVDEEQVETVTGAVKVKRRKTGGEENLPGVDGTPGGNYRG